MASNFDKFWEIFKIEHEKNYETTEEKKRKAIFIDNKKKLDDHNKLHYKGHKSYKLGINKYSDLEASELYSKMNGFKKREGPKLGSEYSSPEDKSKVHSSVDWRYEGAVTPVKDQGQYGTCWAFSATGSLEGQHLIETRKETRNLVSLSEQNLIECSGMGCDGGDQGAAFEFIIEKQGGGINTEKDYPYSPSHCGECKFSKFKVGATVTGYIYLPEGDESALKEAVATVGPIAVSINARDDFFKYHSGIYDDPQAGKDGKDMNHAVLVVGYGTINKKDYWLVKNSYGDSWGIDGYILMSRNEDNQCGIATEACYPLVKSSK